MCGLGRSVVPSTQRNIMFTRPIFVGTASELGLKAAAPKPHRSRAGAKSVLCSATAGTSTPLPWQMAMSEIKKRRDIKTIMIIGAGPIVIGQVT